MTVGKGRDEGRLGRNKCGTVKRKEDKETNAHFSDWVLCFITSAYSAFYEVLFLTTYVGMLSFLSLYM